MTNLIWFREDLRISDNAALYHACIDPSKPVIAFYAITQNFWQQHHMAPSRIAFLLEGVKELAKNLEKLNIPLIIVDVSQYSKEKIAILILDLMQKYQSDTLYFNRQYEIHEIQRDQYVSDYIKNNGLKIFSYDDTIIFPANKILTKQKEYFKVFTPYKRAWIQYAKMQGLPEIYPTPLARKKFLLPDHSLQLLNPLLKNKPQNLHYWPAGELAAQKRLEDFIYNKIVHYAEQRDFPALEATSKLSPYLATGMISPRQCLHAALAYNNGDFDSGYEGAKTWINELLWREFYKMILIAFPRVSKHQAFKPETEKLPWNHNEEHFQAWAQGQTGYPLVDAAMRQLLEMGWMHNRLRMVTAMFLSKTLFLDWRLGEKWFIQHLIDGDLAANNGGWQWSASTGVDAVPYFRIFNPILQSERFDPNGDFIRQYCPELRHLNGKAIHAPWHYQDLLAPPLNYPKPIVKHDIAKKQVIEAFKLI